MVRGKAILTKDFSYNNPVPGRLIRSWDLSSSKKSANEQISNHLKAKQARKPRSYASPKLWPSAQWGFISLLRKWNKFFQINIVTSIFIENCWNLFYMIDNSQKIMPNIFLIKYDQYLQRYLQKTWRGRQLTLKFCVSTK